MEVGLVHCSVAPEQLKSTVMGLPPGFDRSTVWGPEVSVRVMAETLVVSEPGPVGVPPD
jgi:hypothetical protein